MCRFKYAFHCPHVTLINTLDITDILKASPMNSIFLKYFESKWQASTSFLGADGSWSAMMFVNVFSPYGVESVNVSLVMIHFKSDIKSSMCLKIKRTIKWSCWLVQLTAEYTCMIIWLSRWTTKHVYCTKLQDIGGQKIQVALTTSSSKCDIVTCCTRRLPSVPDTRFINMGPKISFLNLSRSVCTMPGRLTSATSFFRWFTYYK